jgi:hypothetical protein
MSDDQLFNATYGLAGYKEVIKIIEQIEYKKNIEIQPLFRSFDHPTSRRAAEQVKPRRIKQTTRLLVAYSSHTDLTAEEASIACNLEKSCYWKRVGELVAAGYIEETGHARKASTGSDQRVCKITPQGIALLASLGI